MTITRRPSPFSELATLRQATDRLSDDTVLRPLAAGTHPGDHVRPTLDVRAAASAGGGA